MTGDAHDHNACGSHSTRLCTFRRHIRHQRGGTSGIKGAPSKAPKQIWFGISHADHAFPRAGIYYSDDKLLQSRIFSYSDTQRHRLGPNYLMLPANAPKSAHHNNHHEVHTSSRMSLSCHTLQG